MEHVLSGPTPSPTVPASYAEALEYLYARTTAGFKFGLERTRALLRELGDPQCAFPAIHIAGTNGKGSSVAVAEALLRGKGLCVGRYTSPHLVDFRERIVVDGAAIPADEVTEFVFRWTPSVEQLGATFFEATTALAFAHFARTKVDVALIETGLGGRLDATNVLLPAAAGVTTIDYDHTEYLGHTLEQIATEKAGIFKPQRPAVIGERDPGLREVLARRAREHLAEPIRVVAEEAAIQDVSLGIDGTHFRLTALGETARLRTPLVGAHQAENVAFTLVLLHAAGGVFATTLAEAAHSLARVQVPGRFQRVGKYLFDVAHNPEGADVLAQTIAAVPLRAPVVAVFCALADKDWRRMLRLLAPVVDRCILTVAPSAPVARAWDLSEAERFARDQGFRADATPDFDAALIRAATLGQTVLVTGSFHTVGDAMTRLQVDPLAR